MIKHIRIKNYRGIQEVDFNVGPAGVVIKGTMGVGKSSVLDAIEAALIGRGISADNIRNGANKAEITIDLDDAQVQRVLRRNGKSDVAVYQGDLKGGKEQIQELLGTSRLDPMDVLLLKGKERYNAIVESLDVRVTLPQLKTWWPKCPENIDCSGNGIRFLAIIAKKAYDTRTTKNAEAKRAREDAERAAATAQQYFGVPETAPDVPALTAAHREAYRVRVELTERAKSSARQKEAYESGVKRIAEYRKQAAERRPASDAVAQAEQALDLKSKLMAGVAVEIDALEQKLGALKKQSAALEYEFSGLQRVLEDLKARRAQADDLEARAKETEQGIKVFDGAAVTPEDLAKAEQAEQAADVAMKAANDVASKIEKAADARRAATEKAKLADQADAEAKRVDAVYKKLTVDAPAELIKTANVPKGFELVNEEPMLDGKSIDLLSDGEKLWFAVELARRANTKCKFIVVDRLECLAEDVRKRFMREATRDGYQLIAALASPGEQVFQVISAEDLEEAKDKAT